VLASRCVQSFEEAWEALSSPSRSIRVVNQGLAEGPRERRIGVCDRTLASPCRSVIPFVVSLSAPR
jgi:hypothetical protein